MEIPFCEYPFSELSDVTILPALCNSSGVAGCVSAAAIESSG